MNLKRHLTLPKKYSSILLGARGTGKSTLLENEFDLTHNVYINLLDPLEEARFALSPNELIDIVESMAEDEQFVIIDEVQKVPKLLDVVHLLLENKKSKKFFVLTGSSARKLKAKGVNLLAGRAFSYSLHPLSYLELGIFFNLEQALSWGMLPKLYTFDEESEKIKFLQTYAQTYLKEEIWAEHLLRKLDPFRKFLEVAAQTNGKLVSFANIARDVGVDDKTVKSYFQLLEDTLIGFHLEPFQHSFRKRLKEAPKFYFIDVGIARALARMLTMHPTPGTSYYGDLFEQFIVVECVKLATLYKSEYKFSYLQTGADLEVDLVIDRPGLPTLFIEIKSTTQVNPSQLSSLMQITKDFGECEAICFSQDPRRKQVDNITVYPWAEGVEHFFGQ
ncbi:MAG: ATPase [marine bacterium B5-7]|nr:MAG: ATPase [marine bacterium B5-7]